MVEPINHRVEGLKSLISQYQDDFRMKAFLNSFLEQIQDLEHAIQDVQSSNDIVNCSEAQLHRIGAELGVERSDMTEYQYRATLALCVWWRQSKGFWYDWFETLPGIPQYTDSDPNKDFYDLLTNFATNTGDGGGWFFATYRDLQGQLLATAAFAPPTNDSYCVALSEFIRKNWAATVSFDCIVFPTVSSSIRVWWSATQGPQYQDATRTVTPSPIQYFWSIYG